MDLQIGKFNYRRDAIVYPLRWDDAEQAFITHTYGMSYKEWFLNDRWSYDYEDFEPNLDLFNDPVERRICLVRLF